jgi:hypothetical protein
MGDGNNHDVLGSYDTDEMGRKAGEQIMPGFASIARPGKRSLRYTLKTLLDLSEKAKRKFITDAIAEPTGIF